MKRLSFYSFLCAVLLMSANVFGQFAGGSGTVADPYQVSNAEQFIEIATNYDNYSGASFIQTADITFAENTFPKVASFSGSYDAQGYQIIAAGNQEQPLFGIVSGTISNLVVDMHGYTVQNGGAILCNELNGGTISYCNVKGNVTGVTAGGIVNTMNSGLIEYCCFTGNVTGYGAVYNAFGYAGGICAIQNGGEIKGSMVAAPSQIHGATLIGFATASGIANERNQAASVTSCYSQATVTMDNLLVGAEQPGADVAAGNGTTINSYPNGEELSGQALADYLNQGLDPVAFIVDEAGNVISVATLPMMAPSNPTGIFVSKTSGNFNAASTWNYTPSDTKQYIISAGHTVTLRNANNIEAGASIIVRDGGNFINTTTSDVTATMEKNITAGMWNFIGFPVKDNTAEGYGVAPLAAVEGDIWALKYDYANNTWDDTYLHWYEGNYDYIKAGNGIFAYPDNNYTLSIEGTLNNADVTVTNTITAIGNGNSALRWMALANPYPAEINIAFLPENQGQGVYLYDGISFGTIQTSGTIKAGQGFFVNMVRQRGVTEYSLTFTKNMINGYSNAKSVSAEREFVSVSVSTDGYKVPVLFAQNDEATDGYDIFDANKMFGNGTVAEPYLLCEGIELCKEEVLSSSYTATMNIKSSESRSVEIIADNIPEGYSLTLIDGALSVEMSEGDVYNADITNGENADRFKLLITKNNVSIADVAETESIRVVNNNRSIAIYGGDAVRTEVYNTLGQKVYETSDRTFDLNNVAAGAYILKIQDGKSVSSAKIVVE